MLRAKSLAWRIFFASVILMPLLLLFSAFMLEKAFRASLFAAERESLLAHTYSMMALSEPDDGFLLLPEVLTNSRFNDPDSGLYAQVVDEEFGPIWQSISLSISPLVDLAPLEKVPMGRLDFKEATINNEKYFISRFNTVWEIDNIDREYQFMVIHSQDQFHEELTRYRTHLAIWLSGLALLLIVIQTAIIRWGLIPLKRLASDIRELESGNIHKLDNNYPNEILPVTENINLLIESEQKQRKRYKNTLGDLAHSLKTPLSVVRSVLEKFNVNTSNFDEHRKSIDEQIDRMANIINHQLNRATANRATFSSNLSIKLLATRIGTALEKVYRDKNIHFECKAADSVQYPAQEDDFMEALGNLIENAFKYGKSQVIVNAIETNSTLTLTIDDDGEGVPEHLREAILERGARVDTTRPGQGIGLAVAAEIVSTYDGGINVENSPLGGAKFILEFPK